MFRARIKLFLCWKNKRHFVNMVTLSYCLKSNVIERNKKFLCSKLHIQNSFEISVRTNRCSMYDTCRNWIKWTNKRAKFRWQRGRCKFNNVPTSICDRAYLFWVRFTIHIVYHFERRLPKNEQLSLEIHQFIVYRNGMCAVCWWICVWIFPLTERMVLKYYITYIST